MSNSFSTGRVETRPVQNDSGSISITILDHSAGPANENPFRQQQAGLGSRTAAAARHRRVGGRHQHHLSARPLGIFNQHRFTRADGTVRSLTRHTRLGQKSWLEVLDRQHPVVGDDFSRPLARFVLPLPGDLLVQLGDSALRCDVTPRRRFGACRLAPSHCSLPTCQLCAGPLGVSRMRQVAFRVSCRRDCAHSPVDADGALAGGQRRVVTAHDEAGIPMPDAVTVDTNTARSRGQLARPDHRRAQAACQTKATVFHSESAFGVVQTGQRALAGLELTTPLTPRPLGAEVPQHLLLGHHRTVAQPLVLAPPARQRIVAHPLTRVVKPFNRLIPHPPAAVPLSLQSLQCSRTGPQPVPIAHDTHAAKATAAVRQERPFLPGLKADGSCGVHR